MSENQLAATPKRSGSVLVRLADRFGVDADKMLSTLKATAFKGKDGEEATNEQLMALCIVAEQYGLNPWTKEIYAFPDKTGIVPVVGVDGWSRIINSHPQFDGMEFRASEILTTPPGGKPCPEWMEVVFHRKDRSHPTVVREYLDEVYRPPFTGKTRDGKPYTKDGPWQSHTKRFLRHKTMIQGARVAFGFVGIFDEDEADRIVNVTRDAGPAERVPDAKPIMPQRRSAAAPRVDEPPPDITAEEEMEARAAVADPAPQDDAEEVVIGDPVEVAEVIPAEKPAAKISAGMRSVITQGLKRLQIPESEFCQAYGCEAVADITTKHASKAFDSLNKMMAAAIGGAQ